MSAPDPPDIAPLTAARADAVAALFADALAAGGAGGWSETGIADALEAGGFGAVAVAADGVVAGAGLCTPAGDDVELVNLAVAAAMRRQTIGRALLGRLLEGGAATGARRMVLEVAETNIRARRLYTQAGFASVGERRGFYRGPDGSVDAIVMARPLTLSE